MCTVSMRAQHELLHVNARHLWLTRQENRGKRSQNHDVKLTRPFLRAWGGAGSRDYLVPRSSPSPIGRGLGTRLACATPSKGNLKRFRGIKLQIYANACGVKNRYGANGNVPMAMSPWPWPRPFSHMRGAYGV